MVHPRGRRPAPGQLARGYLAAGPRVGRQNPTFDGLKRTVEAYVLDFDEDLYGAHAITELTHLVRTQEQFNSIDELIVAMDGDKAAARTLMSQYPSRPQDS